MLRRLFTPRPTTAGDSLRRQRRYRRHLQRQHDRQQPPVTGRPCIILNMTAVGVDGYFDEPGQPTGLVRVWDGRDDRLVTVADALRSR